MQPILVIAAVKQELSYLLSALTGNQLEGQAFPEVYMGQAGDRPVLLALSGIGKVNAASVSSVLLQKWEPALVINTGCAGAYPESGLRVGDLALAGSELFGDEGVLTTEGWKSLECIGIPILERKGNRYFNEIPLSFSAAEQAMRLASAFNIPIRRGRFVTVSTCSGTTARGHELFTRFGGICENMEGAAIAQVAMQYGVDCLEVRGVSNMVEDRDLSRWDIPQAAERAQRFILRYIEQW